jgi:hypothetical protein
MLTIYEACREVPREAQKEFNNGRFKGTDINPMWRIKKLTEMFGACGIGWYYERLDKWSETLASGEVCVFVEIALYIKQDGEWSKPIFGTGGSQLLQMTKKGAYANDEAYKMATTDAISVACKALGMGADIYWGADNTKYVDKKKPEVGEIEGMMADAEATPISKNHIDILLAKAKRFGVNVAEKYGKESIEDLTEAEYGRAMNALAEMGERNG